MYEWIRGEMMLMMMTSQMVVWLLFRRKLERAVLMQLRMVTTTQMVLRPRILSTQLIRRSRKHVLFKMRYQKLCFSFWF